MNLCRSPEFYGRIRCVMFCVVALCLLTAASWLAPGPFRKQERNWKIFYENSKIHTYNMQHLPLPRYVYYYAVTVQHFGITTT